MMSKFIRLLVLFLILSGAASGGRAAIKVVACEPEWAALAEELGGDAVSVKSATTGLQDVHHIQARPSLIAMLRRADLLICTGAGLETGWLPLLQRRANNSRVQVGATGYLEASNYVQLLERPARIDRSQGDVHAQGNPHIQLDPRNLLPVASALTERLVAIDPQHEDDYRARLEAFNVRWNEAIKRWQTRAAPLRGMPIVVHHNAWVYLNHWLGLDTVGTLEPKPGVPPSSAHLSQLLKALSQHPAQVIIRSPYQSERASEWLAERTDIPAIVLPSTVGGSDEATDLFTLYDDIIQRLLGVHS